MTQANNGRHLLIEGLDLAGKSTLCRKLAASIAPTPELRRNALTQGNAIYELADRLRREEILASHHLGHLYVAAMALDLQRYHGPDGLVVQESTIGLRSYCHYAARGDLSRAREIRSLLDSPRYPIFDRAVVLTATLEARRRRLEMRRAEAPEEVAPDDLAVVTNPEIFEAMNGILIEEMRGRHGAVVIDTTSMSTVEVLMATQAALGIHA